MFNLSKILLSLFLISALCPNPGQTKELEALHDDSRELLENKLKGPIAPSPQADLPVRPADLDKKEFSDSIKKYGTGKPTPQDSETPKEQVKLKGVAKTQGVATSATIITKSPLSRYKGDQLKFVRVKIVNKTNQPMLILGSNASLNPKSNELSSSSVGATTLENHDNNLLNTKQKAAVGLASVGTLGFLGPLTYEYMTPSENRKRSLGIALGRDRGRHEVEEERLGLRLIMPQDETLGWLAFKRSSFLTNSKNVYVPVMYPPYKKIDEILTIPITK